MTIKKKKRLQKSPEDIKITPSERKTRQTGGELLIKHRKRFKGASIAQIGQKGRGGGRPCRGKWKPEEGHSGAYYGRYVDIKVKQEKTNKTVGKRSGF